MVSPTPTSLRSLPSWRELALAFLAMSFVHVVVGEVVPKNLAIEKADRLALLVAPGSWSSTVCPPPLCSWSSAAPLDSLAPWSPRPWWRWSFVPEELKFIVRSSRREGHLESFEEDAIQKLIELKDVYAREIMTSPPGHRFRISGCHPRRTAAASRWSTNTRAFLSISTSPNTSSASSTTRTWFALGGSAKSANDRRQPVSQFRLRRYLREPLFVPETKPLNH